MTLNFRRFLVLSLSAALWGLGPVEGVGQGPQEPPPAEFEDQVSVGYVLVPVVVRSGAGYARNLEQEDFRLLVDGRPVGIESFERRAEAPASLVFLQDLSGSMENAGKIQVSREVVRFFLTTSLPGDEFAIATFASGERQVDVPFTADKGALQEAADAWKPYGTTALHDAVAWLPEISLAGRNPKRFAILITDGVDNASRITPEQAREILRAAQLPVYVLGLSGGDPKELTATGEKLYRYADVLNLLAHSTGGRYYSIDSASELQEALTAIAHDLRHQYVLGFATGEGRSTYRTLRVEVEKGRYRPVLFRRGYKGPPPSSSQGG